MIVSDIENGLTCPYCGTKLKGKLLSGIVIDENDGTSIEINVGYCPNCKFMTIIDWDGTSMDDD